MGIRTTAKLKELIERAAAASGRSVAQEIEHRLEESLAADGAFGSPRTAIFFKMLGAGSRLLEKDDAWLDDPEKFKSARRASVDLLENLFDHFAPLTPDEIEWRIKEARAVIEALRQSNSPEERERLRERLHTLRRPQHLPEKVRNEICDAIIADSQRDEVAR